MSSYTIPPAYAGKSAREFLRREVGVSLTLWRKIKQQNEFYINEVQVSPGTAILQPGDILRYALGTESSILPVKLPLSICYEDDWVLIANKPAGQLVHPTTKEHTSTLANAVLYHYQQQGLPLVYHPVHRLDKDTSGLVLIAKEPQIQHQLSTSSQKLFHRCYQALIPGEISPAAGSIEAPIGRKPGSIIERQVVPDGQPALTHYKTLRTNGRLSLLELALETGRTHQIRVHLAHTGHPLLGDDLYGGSLGLLGRQALHAWKLEFMHPVEKRLICVSCPLPSDMQEVLSFFSI